MNRAEIDLQTSVKKACNSDEVPPKRKHVRACIVYTWDHKNSRAFWNAVKIEPIQGSEIQLFKALIMIHKVMQEGHPNTLKDAYRNRDFINSLATVFPSYGASYGRLISQYDKYILQKIDFHRNNPSFNGMFEYEEYISLRAVNDPNEGYEVSLELMDLLDLIDDLQKLIFASINKLPKNLCKVSALVPLIAEAYGIYKFCISMLRGLYQQLGADDALAVLFERFDTHHFVLRDFFTDCYAIKFLSSLITIPRLSNNPPNLQLKDGESKDFSAETEAINEDKNNDSSQHSLSYDQPTETPPPVDLIYLQQTGIFDQAQQEQQRYQQELELKRQQQLQQQIEHQRMFEEQQRQQGQKFLEEQQMLQQQQAQQNQSHLSQLENDLLMFKSQYDNSQVLLEQYDSRVKSLENELMSLNSMASQQLASKDELIQNLEQQIANWSKKYESLAKLYSQLRQEHLSLLAKFKKIQQKISSAQESVARKEKLEKDLKAKNIELADLIRERDKARIEVDRVKGAKDQEIEKLQTELRNLNSELSESGRLQSLNLTSVISRHQDEIREMKAQLDDKENKLTSLGGANLQDKLKEKEMDLEITQESLDSALKELALAKNDQDEIVNAEVDQIIMNNIARLRKLIDLFLINGIKRIQDTKHELNSTSQAGNMNASPEYLLSVLEICSDKATNFANTFNTFIADDKNIYDDENSIFSNILLTSSELASSVYDIMLNYKALARSIAEKDDEKLCDLVLRVLISTESFFGSLLASNLDKIPDAENKIDIVIDGNLQIQNDLQDLGRLVESFTNNPRINFSGNLEDLVRNEMDQTAKIVNDAYEFLNKLLKEPTIKGENFEVHEAILSAAIAVTNAVALLIKAATDSQKEIVSRGKGKQSDTEFYKKNNRWTEGLISASKAIAGATNILIQTSDGVLRNRNSHEELIVASNEVAASTAQLVAASRVKADFMSKTQDNLEGASAQVSRACKGLVGKVQLLLDKGSEVHNDIDLNKLTPYEGKTVEMEQQVEILKLENMLASARKRLGEIRKHGYMDAASDDENS